MTCCSMGSEAKAFGYPAPQRDTRTPYEVARDQGFADIAMQAAGLIHLDGQKRFRADTLDGALFRQCESAARRLLGK
jgi:hypothetical protein